MICCVGSAHIDISASQNGSVGVDQTGDIKVSIGGTAYNVACNLKRLGAEVAIVTVLKDSIFGNIILKKIKNSGIISEWIIEDSAVTEGVFIAIHNHERLLTAVNSTPVDKYHLTVFPKSSVYFVDLNNSIETVRSVFNRQCPVYIGLVSEDKARKLASILEIEDLKLLRCVSGNEAEYRSLLNSSGLSTVEELSFAYPEVEFIYTMHEKGLKVYKAGSIIYQCEGINLDSSNKRLRKQVLGTGDALIAGYIYAREVAGVDTIAAVEYAMQHAVLLKLLTPGSNLLEDSVLKNFDEILYVDQLTKVYNRHYFERRKEKINSNYTVIMIDIDRFKSINDTYGHKAGDVVLKEVAAILKKNIRADDILLRWGGEEFVLFFKGNIEEAIVLAERIRKILELTPINIGEHIINITASFGVSPVFADQSLNDSIIEADRMLYKAKNSGRNRVAHAELYVVSHV